MEVVMAAPRHTSTWVLKPAGRLFISRSMPIIPPQITDNTIFKTTDAIVISLNESNIGNIFHLIFISILYIFY